MPKPTYIASTPETVEAHSIYSKSALTHKWLGHFRRNDTYADMMRSRCGLTERLSNLDTAGSLGRCTKCDRTWPLNVKGDGNG